MSQDAVAKFAVQPALPRGSVLVELVTDDGILRQGRGSIVELSTFDGVLISHMVTAAQQYVDDLYYLEGTKDGTMEELADDLIVPQQSPSGLPFHSIDVSLQSREAIFDAVIYLKKKSRKISFGYRDEFRSTPGSFQSGDNHICHPSNRTLLSTISLTDR